MQSLIFATNNKNKVDEIRSVLNDRFEIISLKESGIDIDIPEPHDTLAKNATEKSQTIYQLTGKNCFSEDTGLEVEALNGEPGVRSARYAGEENDFKKNTGKLLANLKDKENRKAKFRTVVSLILFGNEQQFEGVCEGSITNREKGSNGFGYDAVFVPDGSRKTFGQMSLDEKNRYSHRRKAMAKLIEFLNHSDGQDKT